MYVFVVVLLRLSKRVFVSVDDSRVELANSTLSFVKGAMCFLEDGLRLDTPEVTGICYKAAISHSHVRFPLYFP